jgi:DNA-binding MarR family transcriptional regulator
MTSKGRTLFAAMALEHERWIVDAFASMSPKEVTTLHALLGKVKEQSKSGPAS